VMDIKVGRGAFMKTLPEARELARSIARVGRAAGLRVSALFTDMNAPLGHAVGNALETREAFEVLLGVGPADLVECTFALGAELLQRGGLAKSEAAAHRALEDAQRSRRALRLMERLVKAQGGDARVVSEPDRLPRAPSRLQLRAHKPGHLRTLDALRIGQACIALGAGRARAEDTIDPRVGVWLQKKPGDAVRTGDPLAEIHSADAPSGRRALRELEAAFEIGGRPAESRLVLGRQR